MAGGERDQQIDALLAAVGHSADDELARTSARSRSQRRWLSQEAAESTTLAGTLLTRAERDETVTITTGAAAFRGRLNLVTTRLCVLELEGRQAAVALIPTSAIRAVEGNDGNIADDRVPAADTDLGAILAAVAGDRPSVCVKLNGGAEVSGTLLHVGQDVLAVRHRASVTHVPLGAVAACVLQ